jgi:hypothetical protein
MNLDGKRAKERFMKTRHVVLLNESTKKISTAELTRAAQALQVQVDRDFGPVWGLRAQITALRKGGSIPPKSWPIRIVNKPVGGLGIHLDKGGKPYAQVKDTADWSVTASHELLEMLADPLGHRFISARDIDPNSNGHRVMYLLEVGDPCEMFAYTIGDIAVSDFILPDYYDPSSRAGEVDFMGRLAGPLDVPLGGYISWIDPTDRRWHQKHTDGSFMRAKSKVNDKANPRDDRDASLPERGMDDRHDISRIREAFA